MPRKPSRETLEREHAALSHQNTLLNMALRDRMRGEKPDLAVTWRDEHDADATHTWELWKSCCALGGYVVCYVDSGRKSSLSGVSCIDVRSLDWWLVNKPPRYASGGTAQICDAIDRFRIARERLNRGEPAERPRVCADCDGNGCNNCTLANPDN